MIPIAFHFRAKSIHATLGGLRCPTMGVVPHRDLIPDQHAGFIGGVQITRIGHLDMTAQHIQSQGFGCQHLLAYEIGRWRRVNTLGIEILIESGSHVEGLAVEEEPSIGGGELAKSKACVHPLGRARLCRVIQLQRIEVRVVAIPQHGVGHMRLALRRRSVYGKRELSHGRAVGIEERGLKRTAAGATGQLGFDQLHRRCCAE